MPDMSETFVSDMKTILFSMNDWLSEAILGNASQLRQILCEYLINIEKQSAPINEQEQEKFCDGPNKSKAKMNKISIRVEQHLQALLKLKIKTFEDFSSGIRNQLKLIDMIKVN